MAKWYNYSEKDAPEFVFDDLGLFHEREIPLPSVYKRHPCKCGIIHKWETPETFEIHSLQFLQEGDLLGYPKKHLKRCKKCEETLLLKKEES